MNRLLTSAAVVLMTASTATAQDVTIEVGYPYSGLFDLTYKAIMDEFTKVHPEIKVVFRATYENYEDGANIILRESVAGELPDVTMQGLNRQRVFVEKGIARSLEPFIAKEADFAKDGYHKAMLDLSTFNGEVYGLPFSVSTPIGYYNMDILKAAGVDKIPSNWDEVISACKAIEASTDKEPMFWGWNITGNWFFQAMLWSQGEAMLKGEDMNFNTPAGLKVLTTIKALVDECGMENYSTTDGQAAFSSGEMGMFFWSTSAVGAVERDKGDKFDLKTAPFPGIDGHAPIKLPAGGNAALLVSTSDDPAVVDAAWTFLKFITSGIGAAKVAETTGYVPPNKAANEIIKDFYVANPNKQTAVDQLPLLSEWFAYPGNNGLAITQVIYDKLESIVTGESQDMQALLIEMNEEVADLK
ncbi:ABC transporter substrate-binding protein [uncultured Hoeflea sp.]|uniref:ABC transporter substrate-binding protein n=1 Tax=uncultured Hoeflea sp. TaxID=538666 RepID=UPI0030DDC917